MKAKYKRGRKILCVGDFEKSLATYYRVRFGAKERTIHRSFLMGWQYQTLSCFIGRGCVYEADPTEEEPQTHKRFPVETVFGWREKQKEQAVNMKL